MPALELRGITKRFGDVVANRDVSISVAAGSIHGIVGENGAGKSTLMSILFGEQRPDAGEIRLDGTPVRLASPRDAIARGIGTVHQHFTLVEAMSVLDNIMLGAEGGALLARGRAASRRKLDAMAARFGLSIDADALVEDLPVGLRQRVEILKALMRDARILVLDEPTAALTPNEATDLFRLMRVLRDAGASLLFISHKLGEIMDATDRVSVMRAGEVVASFDTATTDAARLAEAMIGRKASPPARKQSAAAGAPVLRVHELGYVDARGVERLRDISFEARAGEIVGVAGVAGNGQSELLETLAGMRVATRGAVFLDGEKLDPRAIDPAAMRRRGVMHVPEDRMTHGLLLDFPARESAMLGYQHERRYGGALLDPEAIDRDCAKRMSSWDVRPPTPSLTTRRFSGGNQQKIVLAREIDRDPRVLLIGQPTRGVDIGAIETIHARILALRDAGKAVVLVSSELDEVLALSDRVLVMCGGCIVGERRPAETDGRELGLMMAGARTAA